MTLHERLPLRIVAIAAALAGAFLLLGAFGHLYYVVKVHLAHDRSLDFRFVHLLSVGAILLSVGIVDLVASLRMWRGSRYALLVSGVATAALMVYLAVLLTLPHRGDPIREFLLAQASYLTIVLAGAFYMLFRRLTA